MTRSGIIGERAKKLNMSTADFMQMTLEANNWNMLEVSRQLKVNVHAVDYWSRYCKTRHLRDRFAPMLATERWDHWVIEYFYFDRGRPTAVKLRLKSGHTLRMDVDPLVIDLAVADKWLPIVNSTDEADATLTIPDIRKRG